MRDHPVDVLIVDEAGQLGLADTLAASVSASDVILLGDPLQLPQVAQASHPNRSGVSGLDHVIGDDLTIAAEAGGRRRSRPVGERGRASVSREP